MSGTALAYLAQRNQELAMFVRQTRLRCGWTQQQVADLLEISRPTFIRLEKGDVPFEIGQLELICRAFDLEPADFHRSQVGSGQRLAGELQAAVGEDLPPGVLGDSRALVMPEGYGCQPYSATILQFSADSQLVAAPIYRDEELAIAIWKTETGEVHHSLAVAAEPGGLAFSPDSHRLVGVFPDGRLIVWDIQSGQTLEQLPPPPGLPVADRDEEEFEIGSPPARAVFSPDGTYLAVAGGDRPGIRLLACHRSPWQEVRLIDTPGEVVDLVFAPAGNVLWAASREQGVIYAYTIPDGEPWGQMAEGFLSNPDIEPEKVAVLAGQEPREYLVFFGGDGEGLDVERVQLTRTADLQLSVRFFALSNQSDDALDQLVAVRPDTILTVVNQHLKPDIPYWADELHNVFKVKNVISGLAVTVLDMVESTPDIYGELAWHRHRVKLSGDGAWLAVFENELYLRPFNARALRPLVEFPPRAQTVTMMGRPTSYLPNLLYHAMGGIGHPELYPSDRPTFLLEELVQSRGHEQWGVVLATAEDTGLPAALESVIRKVGGEEMQVLTVPVSAAAEARLIRLAGAILAAAGHGWLEQDPEPQTLFSEIIPRAMPWQSKIVVLVDHAERLTGPELALLLRDHPLKWQPLYILIGRDEELLATLSGDFSLAYKSTLIPLEELGL